MKYKNILVLGSEGTIGSHLSKKLKSQGYKVMRHDIALKEKQDFMKLDYDLTMSDTGRSKDFLMQRIQQSDFVFFLAYDVGGSKYLQNKQNDFDFIRNNTLIMNNVFNAIKKQERPKPFVFASSMMASLPSSNYGILKKLGESYTESLGGISVRLWNVFGKEELGEKSHVIPDFIEQAINEKAIRMQTTGTESRQFISTKQSSDALMRIMLNYNNRKEFGFKNNLDISSGVWTSIIELAYMISEIMLEDKEQNKDIVVDQSGNIIKNKTFNPAEYITMGTKKDLVQNDALIEPNILPIVRMGWNPHINLKKELNTMFLKAKKQKTNKKIKNITSSMERSYVSYED